MESRQPAHGLASAVDYQSTKVMLHKDNKMGVVSVSLTDKLPLSVKELISGGVAGALAKTSVAPLERLKILYQTRRGLFQGLGVVGSLGHIKKEEGFRSFYRGNGVSVLRIVPYAGFQFMAYEQYRRWMLEYHPAANGPLVELAAGGLAGGSAVLLTYPLDLARTRLAYQVNSQGTGKVDKVIRSSLPPLSKGIGDVLRNVYKESGIRGLYRGVGATLYGIFPYAGLKFYIYEILKSNLPEDGEPSITGKLACGAVAGCLGQTFTYPLDVVRRQMQVQGNKGLELDTRITEYHMKGTIPPFKGTFDGLIKVMETQGWRQLFAGMSINYMKLIPSVAIGFTVYDGMKSWLRVPPRTKKQSKEQSTPPV
ncbi:hypothetical protein R1sor_025835 [Riccia sorocarpa]|uniref:Mitochondrial carrier protein n=1 Tax=Riccia sorocarpa TaxID=122646 RepID=A0ABD3G9Q6_9MARC